MKHTFTSDKGLTLHIGEETVNLMEIGCYEITSGYEFASIVIKGIGLRNVPQFMCGDWSHKPWDWKGGFECAIFDGHELVIRMYNAYSIHNTCSEIDEVELLFDYCNFGQCRIAAEIDAIHRKNCEYCQNHQFDYCEGYD